MDKPVEFTSEFPRYLDPVHGAVITVRYIYKWLGGTELQFVIGDIVLEKKPIGLWWETDEELQENTILEVVNSPANLKGEWKQVYDEQKNVIVKYFPTPEEEAEQKRIQEAHDKTWEIALMCASL